MTQSRAILLIGMIVLLNSALIAQQQASPEVAAAVAPEWPTFDSTKTEQPQKERVLVKVKMDGFGNVVDARSLAPKSFYSDSAVRAAWQWKFGEPIVHNKVKNVNGMTVTLEFTFRLLPPNSPDGELGTTFIPPYHVQLSRLIRKH